MARLVYEYIVTGRTVVHTLSAQALHTAATAERHQSPNHPSTWVSFVHYGV